MAKYFPNSPCQAGDKPAWVETGIISNVNPRNMTVDWVSQYSGRQICDVQILSPYFHYNNGEGISCLPEIGAICALCAPSDYDPPFIMGFLSGAELEGAEVSKTLADKIEDPGVESEDDIPPTPVVQKGGTSDFTKNANDASFRGGRPILSPGDIYMQGRDENFIVLRRGGVLQLGSTQVCQRLFIPILNFIKDFAENYELTTAAGSMSWVVQRVENNPSGNAATEFMIIAREYAQDKKASIKVSLGSLDDADKPPGGDKTFMEISIAPQGINADNAEVSGSPVYVLRIDKAGNSYSMQAAKHTEEIKGDLDLSVLGKRTSQIRGNDALTVLGNSQVTITGTHSISGASSSEVWAGAKTIAAQIVKLGGGDAAEPVLLGLKLISWLSSHTHLVKALPDPAPGPPTLPTLPPVQAGGLAAMASKTIFTK